MRAVIALYARDVRFVDIDFHFERREIRHCDDRTARETASNRRCDDFTHFRFLAQNGPGERRPDQRVLECCLGVALHCFRCSDPRVRRAHACVRSGKARLCRIDILQRYELRILLANVVHSLDQTLRFRARGFRFHDIGLGGADLRLRLRHLRLVVLVRQARDHLPLPHEGAFAHTEESKPPRHFGRYRRARTRDDVAICGDARAGTTRAAAAGFGRNNDGLHGHNGAPLLHDDERTDQQNGNPGQYEAAPQRAPLARSGRITIDAKLGEIRCWRVHALTL